VDKLRKSIGATSCGSLLSCDELRKVYSVDKLRKSISATSCGRLSSYDKLQKVYGADEMWASLLDADEQRRAPRCDSCRGRRVVTSYGRFLVR